MLGCDSPRVRNGSSRHGTLATILIAPPLQILGELFLAEAIQDALFRDTALALCIRSGAAGWECGQAGIDGVSGGGNAMTDGKYCPWTAICAPRAATAVDR